ncbi:MAG TPA: GNAT family N-acetyltransferase [Nitriliruptoraceae bacterium]|nr:GNAT family N-acetyltransferase [Nitriliruptoraceae bacterium]
MLAMLAEAAAWRDGVLAPVEEVVGPPPIAHYLPQGWPRPGDAGLIATIATRAVGAAWWTHFPAHDPGYGFVAVDIPELSVGVLPDHRGRGVGRALVEALCQRTEHLGIRALSLSVEVDNPAVGLYRSCGFATVDEADGAVTMVRHRHADRNSEDPA